MKSPKSSHEWPRQACHRTPWIVWTLRSLCKWHQRYWVFWWGWRTRIPQTSRRSHRKSCGGLRLDACRLCRDDSRRADDVARFGTRTPRSQILNTKKPKHCRLRLFLNNPLRSLRSYLVDNYITILVNLVKDCMQKYGLFKTTLAVALLIVAWQLPEIMTVIATMMK